MTGGESVEPIFIDPEVQKRGDQMGFVTPVVHALTYGDWMIEIVSRLTYQIAP